MSIDTRINILAAFFLVESYGCNAYSESSEYPNAPNNFFDEHKKKSDYLVTVSFKYATDTGVELETDYQKELTEQNSNGTHIIIIGDFGKPGDALYIGDVNGAVKKLIQSLDGNVKVWKFPNDFSSGEDLLEKLAEYEGTIATVHSFGHGDETQYWISLTPSELSLTIDDITILNQDTRTRLHNRFAEDGYWKFYGCHQAAAQNYEQNPTFAKTVAEVFGIQTIAANSWVFIEGDKRNGVFMYPVSRQKYNQYREAHTSFQSYPAIDLSYSGESAWVTYTPQKK